MQGKCKASASASECKCETWHMKKVCTSMQMQKMQKWEKKCMLNFLKHAKLFKTKLCREVGLGEVDPPKRPDCVFHLQLPPWSDPKMWLFVKFGLTTHIVNT